METQLFGKLMNIYISKLPLVKFSNDLHIVKADGQILVSSS